MRPNLLRFAIVSFAFLAISGCSEPKDISKVDPKNVTTEYYVDFDEDTNILSVIAEFRTGTTSLSLDKGAYISWNGEILEKVTDTELNYIYYKYSKLVNSSDELYITHIFTYKTHDDKLFTNQVTIPNTPTYSVAEISPILLKMAWQIPDQITNDGLGVTIDRLINGSPIQREEFFVRTDTTQNSGTYYVPTSVVEKFGPGSDVEITMCRKRRLNLTEGTQKDGYILAKKCGKTLATTIPKE